MIGDLLVILADIQNQRRQSQIREEEPPMFIWEKAATVALWAIATSAFVGVMLLVEYLPAIAESLVKISESLH